MAITRDKKQDLVAELTTLLMDAKGIAFATYNGLGVADLQKLRKEARQANVTIKVVKNRLVRVAMSNVPTYKETHTSALVGQLIYAVSADDEVAPAQTLYNFAKNHPALELAGGFSGAGVDISADDIKALAVLPSKEQLIAEVISQLLSPVHDSVRALGGDLPGLLDGIAAKAA